MSNLQSVPFLTRQIALYQSVENHRNPVIYAGLLVMQARQAYITAHPTEGTTLEPGQYRDAFGTLYTVDSFPTGMPENHCGAL